MLQRIEDPTTRHPVLAPGQRLPGDFRIDRVLGAGAFGSVYAATGPTGPSALKELRPTPHLTPEQLRERFETEAQMLQVLAPHPCIPRFVAKFECHDTYFLALEFVPGSTLAKLLRQGSTGFSLGEGFAWLVMLTRTIDHMHRKLLLYQDLKPDNIMITPQRLPVLVDFGAARNYAGVNANPFLLFGTPGYVAPEIMVHQDLQLDYRSDIYSLGCLCYTVLTGHILTTDQILGRKGIVAPSRLLLQFRPEAAALPEAWRATLDQLLVQALHPLPDRRLSDLRYFQERLTGLQLGVLNAMPGAAKEVERVEALYAVNRAQPAQTSPAETDEEPLERDPANIYWSPTEIVFAPISSRGTPSTLPVSIYTKSGFVLRGTTSTGSPWLECLERGFSGAEFRLRVRIDPRKVLRINAWSNTHLVLHTKTLFQVRIPCWTFVARPDSPVLLGEQPLPPRGRAGE